MSEWIKCSERRPEKNVDVLFVAQGQICFGGRHSLYSDLWDDLSVTDMCGDCDHYGDNQVTHWMPLPSPPVG